MMTCPTAYAQTPAELFVLLLMRTVPGVIKLTGPYLPCYHCQGHLSAQQARGVSTHVIIISHHRGAMCQDDRQVHLEEVELLVFSRNATLG
jgi:hypothetical protein